MDALDLLFRRLVLAARAAGALERPIEVGEILDTFVPYGSARRDGALETNDDYLHVVMRLVAGERELIFADDLMQDDLVAELASPNPDLPVIRTYANSKLRLSTAGVQRVLTGNTEIDLRPATPLSPAPAIPNGAPASPASSTSPTAARTSAGTAARTSAGTAASEPKTEPRRSGAGFQTVDAATREGTDATSAGVVPASAGTSAPGCPYCAQALPEGRKLKFCPSCGQNLLVRRCAGCSAEIESGWTFCVTCGRKAT